MKRLTIVLASVVWFAVFFVVESRPLPVTSAQVQVPPPATLSSRPTLSQPVGATTALTGAVYSWAKTWTGNNNVDAGTVAVDPSGNLYVVGEFWGTANFDPAGPNASATVTSTKNTCDAFLSKFDSTGAFQWVKTWGGAPAGTPTANYDGRDAASGVALDAAGNVYVAGIFQNTVNFGAGIVITSNAPSGSNNIFVAKFDSNGTVQWVRAWGGKTGGDGYSVAVDKTRGYVYVEGDWSTAPNTGTVDFNPGGGGPGHDWHANHGFFDAFLAKYDLNGNFQWAKTWGGNQYDDGPGVAVDGDGNLYVAGMYGSTDINFDPAGTSKGLGHPASESSSFYVDFFLSKFDPDGNFQWVKTWGTAGTEEAGGSIVVDGANNVYVGGRFGCISANPCNFNPGGTAKLFSSNGDRDAFVIKYDSTSNYQWAKTWGGSGWDSIGGLAVDGANHLSTSGFFANTVDFNPGGGGDVHVSRGGRDIFLNQFDSAGNLQWTKTWGGSGDDMSLGVAFDGTGNLFAVGSFSDTVNFDPWGVADPHVSTAGDGAFLAKFLVLPSAPDLIAPPDGTLTTMQAITLSWQAGSGNAPTGYNVDLDGQVITTSHTTSNTVLATGVHTWTARAYNAAGYSAWAAPAWTFEITATLPVPRSPILVSPSNGSLTTTQAITFTWRANTGAAPAGYHVQVDGNVITATGTSSATLLSTGIHTWTVRAYNVVGYSDWAALWTVEIRRYDIYLPLVMHNP